MSPALRDRKTLPAPSIGGVFVAPLPLPTSGWMGRGCELFDFFDLLYIYYYPF